MTARRPHFWRYKLVETVVGLVVFLLSLPILFLTMWLAGRLVPENTPALAVVVPILLWIVGMTAATWTISKKISNRWSH